MKMPLMLVACIDGFTVFGTSGGFARKSPFYFSVSTAFTSGGCSNSDLPTNQAPCPPCPVLASNPRRLLKN